MRQVPRGSVWVGPLLGLPGILRERGADPQAVFAAAQADLALFEGGEGFIGYRDLGRLLEIAADAIRCPHLGLLVAQSCGLSTFGPIGALAAQAPDIGTALNDFVHHMPRWDRAAVVSLAVAGETATWSFTIHRPDFPGSRLIYEGSVAIMVRVLREFFGPSWAPDQAQFPHKAPGSLRAYRQYFRSPVRFDSGNAGILFAASWLTRRIGGADEAERRAAQVRLAHLDSGKDISFTEQIRRQILLGLPHGPVDAAWIARALGMDASTLRRRLAREKISFRELIRDIQYEKAKHLIRSSVLPIAEVAAVLGYGEPSAFTRAFRLWSGLTPSEWRRRTLGLLPDAPGE